MTKCPYCKTDNQDAITLRTCLDEVNHALNYWYPLAASASPEEREARHVRLFSFRDRLQKQIRPSAPRGSRTEGDFNTRRIASELYDDKSPTEAKPESADPCLNHRDGIPSQHCPCAACNVRTTACGGSALEAALARLKEAQEILAEAPDWKPAQERVRDAEAALDRENERAVASAALSMTPNPL